jgi:hypothetical protein
LSEEEGLLLQSLEDFSDDLDVRSSGTVFGGGGVDDAEDIPLHHADIVEVVFAGGHVTEVLDEVHDIGAVVHGVL